MKTGNDANKNNPIHNMEFYKGKKEVKDERKKEKLWLVDESDKLPRYQRTSLRFLRLIYVK